MDLKSFYCAITIASSTATTVSIPILPSPELRFLSLRMAGNSKFQTWFGS
jgi:hypothetical protein